MLYPMKDLFIKVKRENNNVHELTIIFIFM